jgi:hypothetical protein
MGSTVGNVMTKDVYTVHPDMTILEMDRAFISGDLTDEVGHSGGDLVHRYGAARAHGERDGLF